MLNKVIDRFQSSMKPINSLMAINVEAMEKITAKQTALMTGLMRESLSFSEKLAEQTAFSGVLSSGKESISHINDSVLSTSKDIYDVMTETQEKTGEIMKESFNSAKLSAAKPVKAIKSAVSKAAPSTEK